MHGIFIYWCFVCTLAIFSPRGQDCGWHFWLLADYMKDIPWQKEKNRLVLGPFGYTKLVYVNLNNYKICAISWEYILKFNLKYNVDNSGWTCINFTVVNVSYYS